MNNIVNVALQVLPKGEKKDIYMLVDKAIEVIQLSGLKYRVCPFETVIEGTYDEIMTVVKKAQQACFDSGAYEVISYLKIQINNFKDIRMEDKISKYETKNPVKK